MDAKALIACDPPRSVDIIPVYGANGRISSFETITANKDLRLQSTLLLLTWQRGNDPVFSDKGLPFAEVVMGQMLPAQLAEQANQAVLAVNTASSVSFRTAIIDGVEQLVFDIEVN